ncbi:hypothetical protein Tco_0720767 [Tanacetum coccineum]
MATNEALLKMDSQYFKDKALLMEAKEKGDVLDAESEAFLADVDCTAPYDQPQALTTTNMFQANHEDAYDSDVDEGPNAAVAFNHTTQVEHAWLYNLDLGYGYLGEEPDLEIECIWLLPTEMQSS